VEPNCEKFLKNLNCLQPCPGTRTAKFRVFSTDFWNLFFIVLRASWTEITEIFEKIKHLFFPYWPPGPNYWHCLNYFRIVFDQICWSCSKNVRNLDSEVTNIFQIEFHTALERVSRLLERNYWNFLKKIEHYILTYWPPRPNYWHCQKMLKIVFDHVASSQAKFAEDVQTFSALGQRNY